MTYNPSDPVAKCDSCGQELYEGGSFWTISHDGFNAWEADVNEHTCHRHFSEHYCCVTPCLEKGLITSLRSTLSTPPKQTTPVLGSHQEPCQPWKDRQE